ncbi:MAG: hypothetical protein NC230_06130 [Bacteroides sp.]|nr:hypothetical protein [Bacteroides sp.]
MKKLMILLSAMTLFTMFGCRTNESNYRQAYEKAREKATETGDSATTAMLRQSQLPTMMTIRNVELPVMTIPISSKIDAGCSDCMKKYCIVVARFKQLFNSKSMCERLITDGYTDAFVVHDRQANYYVIAMSTENPTEAAEMLKQISSDSRISLRSPYPFVLRPAHLVR